MPRHINSRSTRREAAHFRYIRVERSLSGITSAATCWLCVVCLLVLTCVSSAIGAPQITATRITNSPPVVDGKLDDPIWQQIEPITDFTQQVPDEGAEPTEKTEVRMAYDERNLYIAFRAFDREPAKIARKVMRRDFGAVVSDLVSVVIDPFGREQDGLYFQVNPNGAVGDGKLDSTSQSPSMDWDTLWDAAANVDDLGWSAEMAIPFQSLTFDPSITDWAINFGRVIIRRQERIRWTAAIRNRSFFRLEDSGRLVGIEPPEKGLGLDLRPYSTLRWRNGRGYEFDAGGEAIYQVTPNISAVLTLNTDFAETEVDFRQVNNTRFPLFFPEKRDFFLEGAEYFNFGANQANVRAFHSRTIGLSDRGEKVDLPVGLKMTGRENRLGVGMFGAGLTSEGALDSDEVFVGRFTYDVLKESRIGTFVSHGDPRGNADNTVAGVDLHFKDSSFVGDNALNVRAWGMFTRDDGEVAENVGVDINYFNQPLGLVFAAEQTGAKFRPGTGFVRRNGRRYRASGRYDWFPESAWIQNYSLSSDNSFNTRIDNAPESQWVSPSLTLRTRMDDILRMEAVFQREVLYRDFQIRPGQIIPAGDYSFNGLGMEIATTYARPVRARLRARFGEYFHGNWKSFEPTLNFRFSKYLQFTVSGLYNEIRLPDPTGQFETLIGRIGLSSTPTPNLTWNALAQWDTVSDGLGIQTRLRWIFEPGREVFLVANQGFDIHETRFTRLNTETAAKVGLTFRF